MLIETEVITGNIDHICRVIFELMPVFKEKVGEEPNLWMLKNLKNPHRLDIEKGIVLDFIKSTEIVCKYDITIPIGNSEIIHRIEIFRFNKLQNLLTIANIVKSIQDTVTDEKTLSNVIRLEQALGIYTYPGSTSIMDKIDRKTIV